jgi:exonuclease III
MKIMSWNCQGHGHPKTVRARQKLITANNPDIIMLMETKKHNITPQFKATFAATYSFFSIDCIVNGDRGRSGGLILLWNHCNCQVDIIDNDFNYIDMTITNTSTNIKWRATDLYGYPQNHNKHLTRSLINILNNNHTNKNWLLFGDLNLIQRETEKFGGNTIDNTTTNLFISTLTLCDLQDHGFNGDIFTWNNRQPGDHLIKARLDRFLANSEWLSVFPHYFNTHLLSYKSDHAPILLEFSPYAGQRQRHHRQKPIRYEQVWTRDENHLHIVKAA